MGKAAAVIEAKSDETGVPGKKPVVATKGKEGCWWEEEEIFGGNKAAATKNPAADRKPAEKEPSMEDREPAA